MAPLGSPGSGSINFISIAQSSRESSHSKLTVLLANLEIQQLSACNVLETQQLIACNVLEHPPHVAQ